MDQETPGGHTVLEAGDRVVIEEYHMPTGERRRRMARVKHTEGGPRAELRVYPDKPEVRPLTAELAELWTVAAEFILAVDDARANGVAPELGPVLVPFQRLRAATGVGLTEHPDSSTPSVGEPEGEASDGRAGDPGRGCPDRGRSLLRR